jgi:hypothetical protein
MDEAKFSQELERGFGIGSVDLGMCFEHHYGILTGQGALQALQNRQLQSLDVDLDQAQA